MIWVLTDGNSGCIDGTKMRKKEIYREIERLKSKRGRETENGAHIE